MTFDSEYDWKAYKRAERGHNSGNHAACHPGRCSAAERLCTLNEERLEAIALLTVIKSRGLNATECLGSDYEAFVALSNAAFPDYPYIQPEPDRVHELQASVYLG